MKKESFDDEEVAEILNKNFISIKVDREERTDIDNIYMSFCQAYAGSGGWPLTIIMTPDKKPFFAGTYFPKEGKHGYHGLIELLNSIHNIWVKDKNKVIEISNDMIKEMLRQSHIDEDTKEDFDKDIVESSFQVLKHYFENEYGGFSKAPKFPTPHNIYFLIRYYNNTKDKDALNMIEKVLQSMYKGGIFDHIGFGFSRYSTDEKWLIPHFEKMLYDNALLALVYSEAYKLTENHLYKEIVKKIFTYLLDKMYYKEGGFYSAEDADSEGVEGKFYVWSKREIEEILGEDESKIFCETYGITQNGNFQGKNIPNLINKDIDKLSKNKDLVKILENIRGSLYKYREQRIHPFKDKKILTSWNGLAITAFTVAGKIFKNQRYVEIAERAADFVLDKLVSKNNRLLVRYKDGESANLGVLEDYAFLIWGLIELYETNSNDKYLDKAVNLNKQMLDLFYDEEHGGLYLYGTDNEQLIIRPKEIYDGAIPSGNSVATLNMIRLYKITNDSKLRDIVKKQFKAFGSTVNKNPSAYLHFITAYMYYTDFIEKI